VYQQHTNSNDSKLLGRGIFPREKHRDTNKILEGILQISTVATNDLKLPSQKMADTSKDELLLGGGIHHVTVRRCITRTVNKFLLK